MFKAQQAREAARKEAPIAREALRADIASWKRPDEPFRFLDLPSELRIMVYCHLLPHDQEICLSGSQVKWRSVENEQKRKTIAAPVLQPTSYNEDEQRWKRGNLLNNNALSLFLVSKFVSSEVRAILYGSNRYILKFDGMRRAANSLSSTDVFGPLGSPHCLSLLRDLRSISMTLDAYTETQSYRDPTGMKGQYWKHRRSHGRLSMFAEILKEHAEDNNQKSLLKILQVHVELPPGPRSSVWERRRRVNGLALEALACLRGIETVQVTGVADWFAKCLQLCIQGNGGDVHEIQYSDVLKRSKVTTNSGRRVWRESVVNTKKWYHPVLDWKEFATRNGIELPADIDTFWMEH